VILEISSKRLGCTAVVDDTNNLLGIITDGDLRRMLQKDTNLSTITAKDIMTRSPKKIEKDEFAVAALHQMQANNITQLVVMNGSQIAGFIHLHDLLKEGIV
jgi:arabinose-5-phosphate isomerase